MTIQSFANPESKSYWMSGQGNLYSFPMSSPRENPINNLELEDSINNLELEDSIDNLEYHDAYFLEEQSRIVADLFKDTWHLNKITTTLNEPLSTQEAKRISDRVQLIIRSLECNNLLKSFVYDENHPSPSILSDHEIDITDDLSDEFSEIIKDLKLTVTRRRLNLDYKAKVLSSFSENFARLANIDPSVYLSDQTIKNAKIIYDRTEETIKQLKTIHETLQSDFQLDSRRPSRLFNVPPSTQKEKKKQREVIHQILQSCFLPDSIPPSQLPPITPSRLPKVPPSMQDAYNNKSDAFRRAIGHDPLGWLMACEDYREPVGLVPYD